MPKVDKTCKLCHADNIVNGMLITSTEGKRLQVAKVIHKHFPSIFPERLKSGRICNDCWSKLQAFHEFYLIVEAVHDSMVNPEFIKVETDEPIGCKQELIEDVAKEATDTDNLLKKYKVLDFPIDDNHSEMEEENYDDDDDDDFDPDDAGNIEDDSDEDYKPRATKSKEDCVYCEDCGKRFASVKAHEKHKKIAHPLPHKCSEVRCIESFPTAEDLNKHMENCSTRKECPICKRMIDKHCFTEHTEKEHKRVLCDLCGEKFPNNHGLLAHRRSYHTIDPVQCELCEKWLDNKRLLWNHKNTAHAPVDNKTQCPICGKVLKTLRMFKIHMRYVHTKTFKEKHKCEICGKSFPRRYRLKEHSSIHTGESVYNCKNCGKSFRFSATLCLHRKKCLPKQV